MGSTNVIIVFVAGTLLLTLFAFSLIVLLITQKNKQNRFRREKEELQIELLKSAMELQEQALTKISQELHDNIGSRLNSIKRNLTAAAMVKDEETVNMLKAQANELLDTVIKDARNISHMLNSEYITSNGLVASVKKELDDVCRTSAINCSFEVHGDYYSLDDQRELLIFRMVQEAIGNAIKHADAQKLSVVMDYIPESFTITITDDGKGFDKANKTEGAGIGLMNMNNRAGMVKGTLNIDTGIDQGTSIRLLINK